MFFISINTGMNLLLSLAQLLWGSLVLSIPFFILVFPAAFLRKRLAEKFKMKWFSSAFISLFVFSLALTALAYVYPLALVSGEWNLGEVPEQLYATPLETAGLWFYAVFKILMVAFAVAVLFSPFLLLGSMLADKLKEKKWNPHAKNFLAVFACTLTGSFLLLFAFNWIPMGLIFYLYHG